MDTAANVGSISIIFCCVKIIFPGIIRKKKVKQVRTFRVCKD